MCHNYENFKFQEWHTSKAFNAKVLLYHNACGRQPNVSAAKAELENLKSEIRKQMEEQGLFKCMGFNYKGSTYEGVKVIKSKNDCPEFDLDFIIRGGKYLCADTADNIFYELKVKEGKPHDLQILDKALEEEVISPEKIMQLFYGSLTKCDFIKQYNVKLRYHGPAVQLDIHHPTTTTLWFQVDLAPTFYLEGTNPCERYSECYIAKSPDTFSLHNKWYRSYSVDEKRIMDKAGGQRKVVLRTLKAMRGRSPQLVVLQSYFLKMCLFSVMDDFLAESHWTVDKTGERFINMLLCIHTCLDVGIMPSYFNGSLNTIKLNEDTRKNIKNLIWRLVTNEKKMYKILEYSPEM